MSSATRGSHPGSLDRRSFLRLLGALPLLAGSSCGGSPPYTDADRTRLAAQRRREAERAGRGPFGPQVYAGYRGLARLPWYEQTPEGRLRCVAEDLPAAIDLHAHLGMALLLAPDLDLLARSQRVRHLLDCDGYDPPLPFDLDVYANGNFTPEELRALRWGVLAQLTTGSARAATQTVPNLLAEMDDCRVERASILPIRFGLPFGDQLEEKWFQAVQRAGAAGRLWVGASVHPRDSACLKQLRRSAARGARVLKLHPGAQRFRPDAPEAMTLYAEAARLGLVVFFHCGRAGIEPEADQRYNQVRFFEPVLRRFPELAIVLGHSGARDVAEVIPMALRHPRVWLGIHGQSVTRLAELVERVGGDRLLFGTDWPFYHLAASHAKVLLVSRGKPALRRALLRGNAEHLLGA